MVDLIWPHCTQWGGGDELGRERIHWYWSNNQLWADLVPPKYKLKSKFAVPVNMTLFGNRVITEVTKLKWYHLRGEIWTQGPTHKEERQCKIVEKIATWMEGCNYKPRKARDSWQPPESRRGKEEFSSRASERAQPHWHLKFGLAFIRVRQ